MDFNKHQHLTCPLYHKNAKTLFELFENRENSRLEKTEKSVVLAIMTEGSAELSCGSASNLLVEKYDMLVIPENVRFSFCFKEKSNLLLFHLMGRTEFCLQIKKKFAKRNEKRVFEMQTLKCNLPVCNVLNIFGDLIEIGVECSVFIQSVIEQLVILIGTLYPAETVAQFFAPVFSDDIQFEMNILAHRNKLFQVNDLASALNMGIDSFRAKFEKIFGMTPQDWIKAERMKMIEDELFTGKNTFKEIACLAGFSTAHEFSRFCKKNFKMTPSLMQKNAKKH